MKPIASLSLVIALAVSGAAFAQSGDMKGMDMQNMDKKSCMDMKGMENMDMKTCMEMMKGMNSDGKAQGTAKKAAVHKTTAVVKEAVPGKGKVTLAHDPVKSLNWPAMTMGFAVKDKALFDKLAVCQKVDVEFTQQGPDYVVTAVK
jgi:Cu(I)/Ag(I) efflux system protein CusF